MTFTRGQQVPSPRGPTRPTNKNPPVSIIDVQKVGNSSLIISTLMKGFNSMQASEMSLFCDHRATGNSAKFSLRTMKFISFQGISVSSALILNKISLVFISLQTFNNVLDQSVKFHWLSCEQRATRSSVKFSLKISEICLVSRKKNH